MDGYTGSVGGRGVCVASVSVSCHSFRVSQRQHTTNERTEQYRLSASKVCDILGSWGGEAG